MIIRPSLREQRLRDALAAVAEYRHATGTDRAYWRRVARVALREFRTLYTIPERQAFERAVAQRAVRPQSLAREQYMQAYAQRQESRR